MKITNEKILEYSKNISVLYVEDDTVLRKSMEKMFSLYFDVLDTAKDGKEALEMYENFKERNRIYYDIVITDINMPNLDGIAMSEEMMLLNE